MNRPITITLEGVQYMIDMDMERQSSSIIYHVKPPQHLTTDIPASFDIVQKEDGNIPCYDEQQALTEKGKQIMHVICEHLQQLPPQFKGGKNQKMGEQG